MGTRSTRVQMPQARFSSQPESTNSGSIIGLLCVSQAWLRVAPRAHTQYATCMHVHVPVHVHVHVPPTSMPVVPF